jgi:hypothetical protein
VAKSKPPPIAFPRIYWPPTPAPAKRAGKKASKPAGKATQAGKRAADGSTRTQAIMPRLPAGPPAWSDSQIRKCDSIAQLDARIASLEDFEIDLGLVCWSVEDELAACRKRIKEIRAEKKRVKVKAAKKRRPPSKPS